MGNLFSHMGHILFLSKTNSEEQELWSKNYVHTFLLSIGLSNLFKSIVLS